MLASAPYILIGASWGTLGALYDITILEFMDKKDILFLLNSNKWW